ncbi:MAG: hypothetical protein HS126_40170 [Anaerolineales bacterium]|nr:hypothetical protein [Anaerolineales bacterium]
MQALAFSSDDRWLATGSLDNTARIWDAVTGEEVARMADEGLPQFVSVLFGPSLSGLMIEPYRMSPVGGVSAIAFSPDGNRLATEVGIIPPKSGRRLLVKKLPVLALDLDDAVGAVDSSPDSRWLLTNSGVFTAPTGNEQLWDVTTGQEVALLPSGDLQNITFSPDGKWQQALVGVNLSRYGRQPTRRKAAQLADKDNVTAIAFSPTSNWLATVSRDNTIRIWELASRREVVRILNAGEVWNINFSSSSRWLITRGNYGSATRVWEVATGREITLPAPEGKIAAVSPDGKWLATRNSYNTVQVWEAATGREVARIELDFKNSVDTIIFSPDSKWLLIEDSWKEGMVQVREAATGREVARIEKDPGKDTPSGLTYVSSIFSPNSRWIAIKNWDSVLLWEAPTGRKVAQLVHEEEVLDMIFSPDSKWLATGSADHTVRVWEAATGQEMARMAHDQAVMALAFSPNGKWLASGSYDGTARVWRLWPDDLITEACARLPHNLTHAEWERFLPGESYHPTCPTLPVPEQ